MFLVFLSGAFGTGVTFTPINTQEQYQAFLISDVPRDGQWEMTLQNAGNGGVPEGTFSYGGQYSSIQPIMTGNNPSSLPMGSSANPQMPGASSPAAAGTEQPGVTGTPVTGVGVPQAGSSSQGSGSGSSSNGKNTSDSKSSSDKSKSSSDSKDKKEKNDKKQKKKDSAASIGILGSLLAATLCLIAV